MVRQIYLIATGIVFTISIWMIFLWAPTEINQGQVQRILYLHVPFAWASMVAIIAIQMTRENKRLFLVVIFILRVSSPSSVPSEGIILKV